MSLYTTLAQPDFYCISSIWSQDSTPAQSEIFVDNMIYLSSQKMISEVYTCTTWNLCKDVIVHYTRTTWLSLHLYKLISGFYTCTTWNLYLYDKMTHFTLHSHTLIFITFAKYNFRGFFILVLCVCFLTNNTNILYVLIFMSKLSCCLLRYRKIEIFQDIFNFIVILFKMHAK